MLKVVLYMALIVGVSSCRTANSWSEPKLIGGRVAEAGQFPATVHLAMPDANNAPINYCTGAFISASHILTAAHCLVEVRDYTGVGVKIRLKERVEGRVLYIYHGVQSKAFGRANIEKIYLPSETVDFLRLHKDWETGEGRQAQDVAVLKLDLDENSFGNVADFGVGQLSDSTVSAGLSFRFGGYGCERNAQISSTADSSGANGERLKYAQGKVSKVHEHFAFGATYRGAARRVSRYVPVTQVGQSMKIQTQLTSMQDP